MYVLDVYAAALWINFSLNASFNEHEKCPGVLRLSEPREAEPASSPAGFWVTGKFHLGTALRSLRCSDESQKVFFYGLSKDRHFKIMFIHLKS